jgi:two-component system OmpR family sensor kinase
VLALALAASYLAGARVSAPLRRMAAVAARVDAGDLAPRMEVAPGRASEVTVLAESFNHMLDRLADAFASQREFLADASHELRTPLTVIRGQLELLAAQESPPTEELRRVERQVREEIGRIGRLVDDLLVLAQAERVDFLRPEQIDLSRFVTELWDGISLTAERRFELGPVPEGSLTADPDRLAQALRNLARNAVEHTREGDGLVRLEVHTRGADHVRFVVSDDGPGIPPAERERVFARFARMDGGRSRATGGAGLGLAIVRAIADAHGGRVWVAESPEGAGARVELELPGFRAPVSQVSRPRR